MKNNKLQPVEIHDLFTYQFPGTLDLSPLGESPLVLLANKNSELATKKTTMLIMDLMPCLKL